MVGRRWREGGDRDRRLALSWSSAGGWRRPLMHGWRRWSVAARAKLTVVILAATCTKLPERLEPGHFRRGVQMHPRLTRRGVLPIDRTDSAAPCELLYRFHLIPILRYRETPGSILIASSEKQARQGMGAACVSKPAVDRNRLHRVAAARSGMRTTGLKRTNKNIIFCIIG